MRNEKKNVVPKSCDELLVWGNLPCAGGNSLARFSQISREVGLIFGGVLRGAYLRIGHTNDDQEAFG